MSKHKTRTIHRRNPMMVLVILSTFVPFFLAGSAVANLIIEGVTFTGVSALVTALALGIMASAYRERLQDISLLGEIIAMQNTSSDSQWRSVTISPPEDIS